MSKQKGKVQDKVKATDRKKQQLLRNSQEILELATQTIGVPVHIVLTPHAEPNSVWSVRIVLLGSVLAEHTWCMSNGDLYATFHLITDDRDKMRRIADEPLLIIVRETSESKNIPAKVSKVGTPTKAFDEKIYADIMKSSVITVDLLPILLGEREIWLSGTTVPTCEGVAVLELNVLVQVQAGNLQEWRGLNCCNVLQFNMDAAYHLPTAKPDQHYTSSLYLPWKDGNHTVFRYDGGYRLPGEKKFSWRRWASLSGMGISASRSLYRQPLQGSYIYNPEGLNISACLYGNDEHICIPVEWESYRRLLLWADDVVFFKQLLEAEIHFPVSLLSPKGQLMAFVKVPQILYSEELDAQVATTIYRFDATQWATALKSPFDEVSNESIARQNVILTNLTAEYDESNITSFLIFHIELLSPLNKEDDIRTLYNMIDPLVATTLRVKPSKSKEELPEKRFQYAVWQTTQDFQQMYQDYKSHIKDSKTGVANQTSLSSFFERAVKWHGYDSTVKMEMQTKELLDTGEWNIDTLNEVEYEDRVWRVERRLWCTVNASSRLGPPPLLPVSQPNVSLSAAIAVGDQQSVLRYTAQNMACHPQDATTILFRLTALCDAGRRGEAMILLQEALLFKSDDYMIMLACAAFEKDCLKKELMLRVVMQLKRDWCIGLASLQVHYSCTNQPHAAEVLNRRLKKYLPLAQIEEKHMGMEQEIWTHKELPKDRIYLICAAFFIRIRAFQMMEDCLRRDEEEADSAEARGSQAYLRAVAAMLNGHDPTVHYASALYHIGPVYHILWLYGEILLRSSVKAEAINSFTRALEGGGTATPIILRARLANLLIVNEEAQKASPLLYQLMQQWSDAPHAWILLGRINEQIGELAIAEQCYETSLVLDRSLSEAWALLAQLAFVRSQPKQARQCLYWMRKYELRKRSMSA